LRVEFTSIVAGTGGIEIEETEEEEVKSKEKFISCN
jgi:hypothetical protein